MGQHLSIRCWYAKDVDVPVKEDDCCQKVAARGFNVDSQLSAGIRGSAWMTPVVPCSLAPGLNSAERLFSIQRKLASTDIRIIMYERSIYRYTLLTHAHTYIKNVKRTLLR